MTEKKERHIYSIDLKKKVKELGITREQLLQEVKTIMKLDKTSAGDVKTIVSSLVFFRDNYQKTIKKYNENFGSVEREIIENR